MHFNDGLYNGTRNNLRFMAKEIAPKSNLLDKWNIISVVYEELLVNTW